jgi:hypothetical protein
LRRRSRACFSVLAAAAWLLGCARHAEAPDAALTVEDLGVLAGGATRVDAFDLQTTAEGAPRLRARTDAEARAWDWRAHGFTEASGGADAAALAARSVIEIGDAAALHALRGAPLAHGALLVEDGAPRGWSPSGCVLPGGARALAYDNGDAGDYDVLLREGAGAALVLAGAAAFAARPSLAADASGRLWAAWETGPAGWGRSPELHGARSISLAVRNGGGDPGEWRAAPGLDALLRAAGPGGARYVTAEHPHLVADAGGALWLFYRAMVEPSEPDAGLRSARTILWQQRALVLTATGWLGPADLPAGDGPNHPCLTALALPEGGVLAVYGTDHRRAHAATVDSWSRTLARGFALHGARLRAPAGAPVTAGWPPHRTGRSAPAGPPPPADPAPELVAEGFVRLWGDLHRHTEFSRCKMDADGTLHDQWRYALDVAALDFLAVTDHMQHADPREWSWQLEMVRSFSVPGRFATLYGLEAALPSGHRNLIAAEYADALAFGEILARGGDPAEQLGARPVLVIPHQLADRQAVFAWRAQDAAHERLVEVFQARRGAYESASGPRRTLDAAPSALWATDHLARGFRFGFAGSSDHQAVLAAYTAVLARGRGRAEVFEALRARRCYAASAKLALDVRLGALQLGEEGAVPADAALIARIAAGAPLAWVEIVRNGAVARRWEGGADGPRLFLLRSGLTRDAERGLRVSVQGGRVLRAEPWHCEPDDTLRSDADGAIAADWVVNPLDEDGVLLWIEPAAGEALRVRVTLPDGSAEKILDAEDVAAGAEVFRLGKARVGLEGGRAPLGVERGEFEYAPGDWQAGDWVYLRLQRCDGEAAWTSPFFVTGN